MSTTTPSATTSTKLAIGYQSIQSVQPHTVPVKVAITKEATVTASATNNSIDPMTASAASTRRDPKRSSGCATDLNAKNVRSTATIAAITHDIGPLYQGSQRRLSSGLKSVRATVARRMTTASAMSVITSTTHARRSFLKNGAMTRPRDPATLGTM